MKKRFPVSDLCCANCAAKMEDAIRRIDGVTAVTVSVLTEKLTLDADDERFDAILDQAVAICKKMEPDCVIHR